MSGLAVSTPEFVEGKPLIAVSGYDTLRSTAPVYPSNVPGSAEKSHVPKNANISAEPLKLTSWRPYNL